MKEYPHLYHADATADVDGDVTIGSPALPRVISASPAEFGGPGNRWSPETLLVAAVADCFILTFRAVAAAARLPWISVRCGAEGTLDRLDRIVQFTEFRVRAALTVPPGTDEGQARRALERAERACLVSNSLKAPVHLEIEVTTAGAGEPLLA